MPIQKQLGESFYLTHRVQGSCSGLKLLTSKVSQKVNALSAVDVVGDRDVLSDRRMTP